MEPALRLERLTKTFGAVRGADELNLVVPRGATYGFIGPSGAGKTTCIRIIMSILFADSGAVSVLGHRSALDAKNRIGYLPEERGVYRRMRVGDFLTYVAQLKGVPEDEALPRASALLEQTGLVNVEKKRCEELSKGMLHRVEFVAAIINRPELIILDEPFSGLDPVRVKRLKELVAGEQRRGATILFSTHIMAHAEELCQHVVMIHRGRKVLDEPMAGLRRQYDPRTIQVEPLDEGTPLQVLHEIAGVADVQPTVDGCDVHLRPGADPMAAMLPYMLSPMIGRAPNSPLSVALSFIPPVNTIAMMTRMASDVPPPAWQVWLTLIVGIGGACAAVWFAGKVFKVGLLMHGKPPNVRTLVRWAREA